MRGRWTILLATLAMMLVTPILALHDSLWQLALANPRQPMAEGFPIPVQRLPGLRVLFLTLKHHMESTFGDARMPYLLLQSKRAREEFMRGMPEDQVRDVSRKYLQGIALWQEFQRVASAVLRLQASGSEYTYADLLDAYEGRRSLSVPAHASTLLTDALVARMVLLGYAPKEIADVATGRLTIRALDNARKMLMLGRTEEEVARYLEAHIQTGESESSGITPQPANKPSQSPSAPIARSRFGVRSALGPGMASSRAKFDAAIVRYSEKYGVDPHLVRAVVRHESNWNPEARSRVGAIGLMQLMPGTARLLGVNPFDPIQNIEGGVRYLAGLLDYFGGNLEATLLGYIGGPLYAKSWLSGRTVPYGEVRSYVSNVKRAYQNKAS